MRIFSGERSIKALGVVCMLAVLTLAGCGGGGSGSTSTGGNSSIHLVVSAKNDTDGQLLGEMYAQLLKAKGYTVETKIPGGTTPIVEGAIKSGAVDIFPEFTGTALSLLKQPSTQDAHAAFATVSQMYEQQFKVTWLDPAYNLNDSYAICTSQAVATKYNLTSLSDLATVADKLNIATPQDGIDAAVNPVQTGYGFKFGKVTQIQDPLTFEAVQKGNADVNVCYTTSPVILTDNFKVLTDSKNVFPIYNPAPLVRDSVLAKAPGIKDALNPLETHLTTDKQVKLIKEVSVDGKSVHDVAQQFLKDEGLLK